MLDRVKLSLRVSTDKFDSEINGLIVSALKDLSIAGVVDEASGTAFAKTCTDDIVITAVCTYVKLHFGEVANYDRLKASYDEQKAQLSMSTGYTKW